jgi:hypothetical protein
LEVGVGCSKWKLSSEIVGMSDSDI